MDITFYGHSCFAVQVGNRTLLFDPYITGNPLAAEIDVRKIKADYILISHGHKAHLGDAVELARQTNATVISNMEIVRWIMNHGITSTHGMNIGGHWFFDFGKVKCVNAVHSSSLPDGSYGGNPMGFLIETSEGNFYYAGDTALHLDMKLIGDFKKIDFAFLPIGSNYTMGVDNAVIASDFIRCDHILGMHYDTYETIQIDHTDAKKKFELAGKELTLMKIGETISIRHSILS